MNADRKANALVEERVEAVERLVVRGWSRAEIAAECRRAYNVSSRTAYRYVERVFERWRDEAAELGSPSQAREIARTRLRKELEYLGKEALEAGEFSAALKARELRAKLDGFNAADELKVEAGETLQHGIAALLGKKPPEATDLDG